MTKHEKEGNGVVVEPEGSVTEIDVIVPVHNRRELATPCLEMLAREAASAPGINLLVVDQMSTDGVADVARSLGFTVVESNARTAGALRNVGVDHTNARWLCFIDSDVLIPPGYFQRLRAALVEHPGTLVGCNYGLPEQPHWTERTWDVMTVRRGDGDRPWLNAGNMALERELFVSVGQFDAALTSGEDTELCRRVLERGVRVLQLQSLDAAHLGNPKGLKAFLRKQMWHGQGAPLSDRNSLAAMGTVGAYLLAVLVLVMGTPLDSVAARIGLALLIANAVPLLAFAIQAAKLPSAPAMLPALALLHTYFVGRFLALIVRDGRQR
jgi:hypothetical protein